MYNYILDKIKYTNRLIEFNKKLDDLYSENIPSFEEIKIVDKAELIVKYWFCPLMDLYAIQIEECPQDIIKYYYSQWDKLPSAIPASEIYDMLCILPTKIRSEIIQNSDFQIKSAIEQQLDHREKENFIKTIESDPVNCQKLGCVCPMIFGMYIANKSDIEGLDNVIKNDSDMPMNVQTIRTLLGEGQDRLSIILERNDDTQAFYDMESNTFRAFPEIDDSLDENEQEEIFAEWLYYQYFLNKFTLLAAFYIGSQNELSELEKEVQHKIFVNNATQEYRDILYKHDSSFVFAGITVDADIFKKPTEGDEKEFFVDIHPTVIDGGGKLATLLNLMEYYKILPKHSKIQNETLIYRLTGRCRPQMIVLPKIKIGTDSLDALYYIIKGIVLKTSELSDEIIYDKIKRFFTGVEFPKDANDIQFDLVDSFVRDLDELYPGVFGEGAPIIEKQTDDMSLSEPIIPSAFRLPTDLFDHPEKYEADRKANRRLRKEIGKEDILKLEKILLNLVKNKFISGDYITQHSFFMIISGLQVNKRCDFQPVRIDTPMAAEAVCSVVKKLCEKPNYGALKKDFIIPQKSNIEFRSPNIRTNEIQKLLDMYFPNI